MKKILLTFFLAIMLLSVKAQFGQLLGWQLSNPNPAQPAVATTAFYQALGLETSTLSRGTGFSAASLTRGFSSTLLSYGGTPTVKGANEYYQFTVQARTGHVLSLSGIDAKLRRSGAGANMYRWAYSVDGGMFTDIGAADVSFTDANALGIQQPTVDLNLIPQLQNLSPSTVITFRLYGWGFSSSTGTFAFGQNTATDLTPVLALSGTVTGGELLSAWNFNMANAGGATTGSETSVTATTVNTNLDASVLTKNGFGNGSLPRGISAIGTIGAVKVDGEYYEFDVTPNVMNKYVTLSSIDARLRRTSGGATTYAWSYSINNAAFVQIGSPTAFVVADDGYTQPTVDLSLITELRNLPSTSTVKFRLHGWGFTTAGGTFAIGRYAADQVQNSLELRGWVTDAPLPVKLTSFTAKANKQGSVNLAWSTASEKDNAHFEVTRATDGLNFSKLAEVKGNGNSDELKNYSYTDTKPVVGINYYRLRQVDNDGKSALSTIAIAKMGLGNDNLTVAVAGNRSSVAVTYNAPINGKALFNIYNVSGVKVASLEQKVNTGLNQINIPVNLGNSLYVLNVSQAGSTASTKF
jgi:hypothetical protein